LVATTLLTEAKAEVDDVVPVDVRLDALGEVANVLHDPADHHSAFGCVSGRLVTSSRVEVDRDADLGRTPPPTARERPRHTATRSPNARSRGTRPAA
jgi:hypothetical protein